MNMVQKTEKGPTALPRFDGVNELLTYIRSNTEYVRRLKEAEGEAQRMEEHYHDAGAEVGLFLPPGSELSYEYQGSQPALQDRRYFIYNRSGKDTVDGWERASKAP